MAVLLARPEVGEKWRLRADSPALRRPLADADAAAAAAAAAVAALDGLGDGGGGGDDGNDAQRPGDGGNGGGHDHDDGANDGANDDDDEGGVARRAHMPLLPNVHMDQLRDQGLTLFNAIMRADASKAHKSKLLRELELLFLGGRKAVSTVKIRPLNDKRRGRARPAAAVAVDADDDETEEDVGEARKRKQQALRKKIRPARKTRR